MCVNLGRFAANKKLLYSVLKVFECIQIQKSDVEIFLFLILNRFIKILSPAILINVNSKNQF